jgi:hypothetical protein
MVDRVGKEVGLLALDLLIVDVIRHLNVCVHASPTLAKCVDRWPHASVDRQAHHQDDRGTVWLPLFSSLRPWERWRLISSPWPCKWLLYPSTQQILRRSTCLRTDCPFGMQDRVCMSFS